MYTIQISYQTGDSFHTEDTSDTVGHVWEDLDKAKEALVFIKEHNEAAADIPHNEKDFIKKYGDRPWCRKEYPFFGLLIPDDKGGSSSIDCFWCGYFERLYGADIITEGDTGMSFEV